MFGLLLVLFVVIPTIELYVILQVGSAIGAFETIAALIVVSAVGAWLCKQQGFTVLRRVQDALDIGRIPARELQDGALILLAGALLLTPGFLGDILGILLLLPPSRAVARALLARLLRGRLRVSGLASTAAAPGTGAAGWGATVVDVDGRPRDRDDERGGPGPIPLGP